jgi:predicted solute-binding protein
VITQGISIIANKSTLSIKVENITAADVNIIIATKETSRINRFLLDVL